MHSNLCRGVTFILLTQTTTDEITICPLLAGALLKRRLLSLERQPCTLALCRQVTKILKQSLERNDILMQSKFWSMIDKNVRGSILGSHVTSSFSKIET